MNDLVNLPPPEKKVAAKVLVNEGYSTREVEDILGLDHSVVARYAKLETPENMQQFETKLTDVFRIKEHQIAAKALRRIDTKIDNAFIKDALEVYKAMRGKDVAQNMTQINVGSKEGNTINFVNFKNESKG